MTAGNQAMSICVTSPSVSASYDRPCPAQSATHDIKGEYQTTRGAEYCVERAEAQVVVVTRPLR